MLSVHPPIPRPIFMKLCMYITALEPISKTYFINPSHYSLCLYVCPPIVARQRLGKHIPMATNIRNNKRTVVCVVFFTIQVVSKIVCGSVYPPIFARQPLGKRQRSIVGGVVLYSVRVVSKESRRLVLTRTSFIWTYKISSSVNPCREIWKQQDKPSGHLTGLCM
jgi:hypothetical protein